MMNPSLIAMLSDSYSQQMQASARHSRAPYSDGILEKRTQAAVRLLRAGIRRG